jgi:RNA polymerase sigma factor (sigma-70 family)
MRTLTDRELWLSAAGGASEAFGELYERHANAIYNYCFRRSGDWALAEDLTATVFLEAWRRRRKVTFDREDAVLPWLFAVANNVHRNHARGHRRLARFLGELVVGAHGGREPSEQVTEEEELRRVLAAVSRIPRREQDVLALCVFGDLSYEQAAIALDVPIGTVRSRLARARSRLRELLPEKGHGPADGASSLPRTTA